MTRKAGITIDGLSRLTGIFSIVAGLLYVGIQFIHPAESLSSVVTTSWVVVSIISLMMSLFFLLGIIGIYTRQVEEAGWLGLIGFVLFSLFWIMSMIFGFIEAFVLPTISGYAPQYVEGILGIFSGVESEVPLGLFSVLAPVAGGMYLLGGLLFGVATFRAGVFPRMAGALLAFGAVVTLAAAVIPHPTDRILAIPMGLAFIWLGYVLWSKQIGER